MSLPCLSPFHLHGSRRVCQLHCVRLGTPTDHITTKSFLKVLFLVWAVLSQGRSLDHHRGLFMRLHLPRQSRGTPASAFTEGNERHAAHTCVSAGAAPGETPQRAGVERELADSMAQSPCLRIGQAVVICKFNYQDDLNKKTHKWKQSSNSEHPAHYILSRIFFLLCFSQAICSLSHQLKWSSSAEPPRVNTLSSYAPLFPQLNLKFDNWASIT